MKAQIQPEEWPIVLGTSWSEAQKKAWYEGVIAEGKTNDYREDVVSRLQKLPANTHTLEQYGVIRTPKENYPALRVTVGDLRNGKPNILITAGVHGYESSGVEAATRFLQSDARNLTNSFNFVVYPCISPWAYEYDQRWNWQAEDVNRNFSTYKDIVQIDECATFMTSIQNTFSLYPYAAAIDLHETNDRDIELRQMRASRFGTKLDPDFEHIPQGFYLTLTDKRSEWRNELQREFGEAILNNVRQISPIAPDRKILGVENEGGLLLATAKPNLMRGFIANYARLAAITEVYPNHTEMDDEKAVQTQLAAIHGALDYVMTA